MVKIEQTGGRLTEEEILHGKEDAYGIYQINRKGAGRDYAFLSFDSLRSKGKVPERTEYQLVYSDILGADENRDSLFTKFNIAHPDDFTGHSLSVSDIILIKRNGKVNVSYVDMIGFVPLPDFYKEPSLRVVEQITESTKGFTAEGHFGTWHSIQMQEFHNEKFFQMRHDEFGKQVADIIVNEQGQVIAEDLWHGFSPEAMKLIGEYLLDKSLHDKKEAALSYAEVKALATGNPKIKEKMDLDIQETKLKMLKANYESNLFRLQDAIAVEYPQQIAKYEELTSAYEADIIHLDTALNTPFSMEIHGITYNDEKTAGEILVQACTKMKKEHTDAADIGTFKGFKMKVSYSLFDNNFYVKLTRESSVTVEVKKDPVRNIERILTALRKMPGQKEVAEERLEGARQQLVQAREEVKKPFEKENELRSVQERLTKINAELDMKPKEEPKKMIKKEELKKCL